jgi:hypothetical protein
MTNFYLIIYDLKVRSIKLNLKYCTKWYIALLFQTVSVTFIEVVSWTLLHLHRPANSYVYNATQKKGVCIYLHCCARTTFSYILLMGVSKEGCLGLLQGPHYIIHQTAGFISNTWHLVFHILTDRFIGNNKGNPQRYKVGASCKFGQDVSMTLYCCCMVYCFVLKFASLVIRPFFW